MAMNRRCVAEVLTFHALVRPVYPAESASVCTAAWGMIVPGGNFKSMYLSNDPTSPAADGVGKASIFAVVVLYKMLPDESATLRTLFEAAHAAADLPLRLAISIFDNTPGGQDLAGRDVGVLPEDVRYQAAMDNPGLAVAYNAAIAAAIGEEFQWLLTLDQDTDLPRDFLEILLRYVERYSADDRVGAIVPHIVDSGRRISPLRQLGGFLPSVISPDFSGVAEPFTTALNSASLLRVSALEEIGGYDERFPLNNSDTSLFHRLGLAGKRVVVAGDLIVQHELAIMNRQDRMTVDRYRQLLADERAFWDLNLGVLARVERLLRLVGRVGKDLLQMKNKQFRALTLEEIRYRVMTRRRSRVVAWKKAMDARREPV